jgi:putative spermidine/putrescine transport system ATP-binding protein
MAVTTTTMGFEAPAMGFDSEPVPRIGDSALAGRNMNGSIDTSAEQAVRLEGVSKRYGQSTVLHNIDLTVKRGEFLTLLGPSGSGKSTILNIVSGSAAPTTGRVFLDGEDVTTKPARERGLGMVFQNYALMPHMTVFDNVGFPLKIRHWKAEDLRRRVMATLDKVGLSAFAQRKPKELSGGQQQRVSIARCLVYSPSIILMDEPLGALDKKLRDQLQGEIKSLHRDIGTTLIYVTHDQEEALNLSDKVCLMNHGRIEQLGSPADLYFDPVNRFVADFVGESNIMAGTLLEPDLLRTNAGTLMHVHGRQPVGETEVEVLIRPENVRILHPGESPGDDNVVDAIVAQLSFVGGRTRVEATIGTERLIATRISARNDTAIQPGEKVRLAWSRMNAVILN